MTIKTTIIATTTALAIAAGSITVPATASAAPMGAMKTAQIETQAVGVEEVKRKRKRHRRGGRHNRHFNNGAAAAIGVGALIVGAAIAANAAPRRRCRIVEVERWSPRYQAYIIREQRVCR